LPHLSILPPSVSAKQRVLKLSGDQPEEGIYGYGETRYEKKKVLRTE